MARRAKPPATKKPATKKPAAKRPPKKPAARKSSAGKPGAARPATIDPASFNAVLEDAADKLAAKPRKLSADDKFGDKAWLSKRRTAVRGGGLPPLEPAYVLPESRHEPAAGLTVGEIESMVAGAVTTALEDKRRGAPKGNRFWEMRSSHGRKPKFAKAEDLRAACCEYFEWVEEHPLHEEVLVSHKGETVHETVAKMRPMTLEGLCIFLDIDVTTWALWRKPAEEGGRKDLFGVIGWVENVIRTQKFEGAAAGFLSANIISRDLGLADRTASTLEAGDTLAQFLTQVAQQPLFGRRA